MKENSAILTLLQRVFEQNLGAADQILEDMTGEQAAEVLLSLPVPLVARILRVLQIDYAAILLQDADDEFLVEMISHLDPQCCSYFPAFSDHLVKTRFFDTIVHSPVLTFW